MGKTGRLFGQLWAENAHDTGGVRSWGWRLWATVGKILGGSGYRGQKLPRVWAAMGKTGRVFGKLWAENAHDTGGVRS